MSALSSTIARSIPGTHFPLRARHALLAAGAASGLLVACWYVAFHSVAVAQVDAHAYFAFLGLSQHHAEIGRLAHVFTNLCQAHNYAFLGGLMIALALLRRRWSLALVLLVIIPAAPLSADVLKPLLISHRPAVGVPATPISANGSWPSGHSAAAMMLALALLMASPSRWRPYAAVLGSAFALSVIYAVLVLGWHYPSDALGGILVALIWTLLGVAVVLAADARFGRDLSQLAVDRRHWLAHMPSVPAMMAAAAIPAAVVLLWRGSQALGFAAHHMSFVAAAIGVAIVAVAAPTALAMVLSGTERRVVLRPVDGSAQIRR